MTKIDTAESPREALLSGRDVVRVVELMLDRLDRLDGARISDGFHDVRLFTEQQVKEWIVEEVFTLTDGDLDAVQGVSQA